MWLLRCWRKSIVSIGSPNETSEPLVEKRDIVIAIDPGHGGKDDASSYGVVEKQVVLKIAKRVATI